MSAAAAAPALLPPTIQLIERGWLSSNSIFFAAGNGDIAGAALIDSGYAGQSAQTLALVTAALQKSAAVGRRSTLSLERLINTHSHADHIGGNATLKQAFGCEIIIPEGLSPVIAQWDEDALLLAPAGQRGERFIHDSTLAAGDEIELGGLVWQAIAAPGHDMHAVIFYCQEKRLLISGDALWEDGFGVVFGELMGDPQALPAARATLETIARLAIDLVIPGHGRAFADVDAALARAFARLDAYEKDSARLARNALRACFTFNLLDQQRLRIDTLPDYLDSIPFFVTARTHLLAQDSTAFAEWLVADLLRAKAVAVDQGWLVPLMAA